MNDFLTNLSLVLAHTIVWEKKEEYPDSEDVQGFDFGGSDNKSSNKFTRSGTTSNQKQTNLPDFLKDIITQNITNSSVPDSIATGENNFLSGLLSRDNAQVLNRSSLDSIISQDPQGYTGKGSLEATANIDPRSASFEQQTTNRYKDTVAQALSQIQSGPDSVRGGQQRVGIAKGEAADKMGLQRTDEIRRAQATDTGLQQNASQIMAAIEAGRKAMIVGAQDTLMKQFLGGEEHGIEAVRSVDARRGINTGNTALAARELGSESSTVSEALKGIGNQSGSSSQWGVNVLGGCCFIFLEVLNGDLPWYARRGRDLFNSPSRRRGYLRMSGFLVPLMRKNRLVKGFVNRFMVKPFLRLGEWFFEPDVRQPWELWPLCWTWFKIWDFLGRKEGK